MSKRWPERHTSFKIQGHEWCKGTRRALSVRKKLPTLDSLGVWGKRCFSFDSDFFWNFWCFWNRFWFYKIAMAQIRSPLSIHLIYKLLKWLIHWKYVLYARLGETWCIYTPQFVLKSQAWSVLNTTPFEPSTYEHTNTSISNNANFIWTSLDLRAVLKEKKDT